MATDKVATAHKEVGEATTEAKSGSKSFSTVILGREKGVLKMSERSAHPEEGEGFQLLSGRTVSRREFLKIASLAGATVGLGAGLGGLLAACGGGETTTTSA
ncbi:MAG: hypothetical protein H5T84_04565, partial [Thermoleophilia bacterium]|nr:hypothetical protein [Thermoleophilia bacterium]